MPLLSVEDLRIDLGQGDGRVRRGRERVVSSIGRGESLRAGRRIRLRQEHHRARRSWVCCSRRCAIGGGRIRLDGAEIQDASTRPRCAGCAASSIAMIFQEPMTALNPLSPVGRQIAEMFVLHEGASWSDAQDRAVEALRQVRVPSARAPRSRLSAPALGRHAPAGDDRDRARLRSATC